MGLDAKITNIKSIDFTLKNKDYTLHFLDETSMALFSNDGKKSKVAEFDLSTGKNEWYVSHCCGAQGFGYRPGDTCPACQNSASGGKIEEKAGNFSTLMIHSGYSQTLSDFVTKVIPERLYRVNKILN